VLDQVLVEVVHQVRASTASSSGSPAGGPGAGEPHAACVQDSIWGESPARAGNGWSWS